MSSVPAAVQTAKIWIKAMRLPFLTATFVPVVVGTAIAWRQTGSLNLLYFALTLATVALAHVGTNLTNDYYDHLSGNDQANLKFSSFSGGSRVIQDGQIAAKHILYAALLCFSGAMALGTYLLAVTGKPAIVLFGLAGVLCGFFYTASPVRIGYRALGELAVGFGFGPLTVIGSYWIQTSSFGLVPVMASVPVGILIMLVLLINEFPDREADEAVGKRTLVVLLGKEKALGLYHSLLVATYVFIVGMVLGRVFPVLCLAALGTLPIAHRAITVSKRSYSTYPALLPANAATISLHLLVGVSLAAAFFLTRLLGIPT